MRKLFTLFALLPFMAFTASAQSILKGDVNEDGAVDISDVVALVNIILNGSGGQSYLNCPDNHHPHMIDLGLPSGTKWACCNVGATAPQGDGGYYAWGETDEKDVYDWTTYIRSGGTEESCQNLGANISGTQYDVATKKWGNSWQMPSSEQIKELVDNCTCEWVEYNGSKGMKFTGPNDGFIFLPAAGYRDGSNLFSRGSGYYWSGTQYSSYDYCAYGLFFNSGISILYDYDRYLGQPVRPVAK